MFLSLKEMNLPTRWFKVDNGSILTICQLEVQNCTPKIKFSITIERADLTWSALAYGMAINTVNPPIESPKDLETILKNFDDKKVCTG